MGAGRCDTPPRPDTATASRPWTESGPIANEIEFGDRIHLLNGYQSWQGGYLDSLNTGTKNTESLGNLGLMHLLNCSNAVWPWGFPPAPPGTTRLPAIRASPRRAALNGALLGASPRSDVSWAPLAMFSASFRPGSRCGAFGPLVWTDGLPYAGKRFHKERW